MLFLCSQKIVPYQIKMKTQKRKHLSRRPFMPRRSALTAEQK